jgi:transcriptional regulator of acetoin/glycerol metabolism
LAATGGNKTEAASLLGVSRTTLWDKVKTYGLD